MSFEFFRFEGYGQFVWPAFIFTLILLYVLYAKVKKELSEQENIYLKENKKFQTIQIKAINNKETTQEALSGNSI